MEYDLWRQWQAFAAGAAPSFAAGAAPSFATGAGAPPAGAFGFAPYIDAAERFAAATRSFHQGAANGSEPAAAAAAQLFGNFLRDQFADFFKMSGGAQPWGGAPAGRADHPLAAALPALGLTREHQERAQRAAQAWSEMDDAQRRLQRLWSDTLREAASAFVARLGAAQSAPLTPEALNRHYDSWIDCAEEAYARTAHSEAFCDALADYVNATSRWRGESNAGAEVWAKLLDLPTRHEINTLAQRLRELEERVQAQSEARQPKSAPVHCARIPCASIRCAQEPQRAAQTAPAAHVQAMTHANLYAALTEARHCAAGCSDKEEVWRKGKLRLYRYRSIAKPAGAPPLLIVYALVNRPYMMDLQEDRSLIRGLLSQGLDVYLIDWGYPDGADRFTTLADYIEDQLKGCVDQILEQHALDALNLLGVCQGGVLSLCFSALHPESVRNLITMVTPVDFHTPADLLSKWVRKIDVGAWVGNGNVSGDALNQLFLSLMPFRLMHQKYMELLRGAPDRARIENFMRVEQWIFDSPDQAGAAFRDFVVWMYQENRLARGRLEIAGRAVDLKSLELPMLNLIGKKDHLVPPASSEALKRLVGSRDFTTLEFDLGHIGMYVSARAQREVPPAIAQWLAAR